MIIVKHLRILISDIYEVLNLFLGTYVSELVFGTHMCQIKDPVFGV